MRRCSFLLILLCLYGWAVPSWAADYQLETITTDLQYPWCLAFLPDGDMLVTERIGNLRRIDHQGNLSAPISGVPAVFVKGQGGLFDVTLAPDFAISGWLYLSYAHGDKHNNATRIARAKLSGTQLSELEVIFEVTPSKDTPVHYGGRMVFLEDGTLMMTTGDGFDYREQAQALDTTLGKTIRIQADGTIPNDNPFLLEPSANPAIWTYGHRNPQGLVHDPLTNNVYLHEHGPRGGDELNLIKRGKNYGWPVITHGLDYNGAYVSPFKERPNMKQALLYWVPSIAPAGLTIYRGSQFPEWQGDLFVAALVDQDVKRLQLVDGKVTHQESLFAEIGERIRDLRTGPDGLLYILTDSEGGRVIRVAPAD